MKYPPQEARCVFIDGPVAVYVSQANPQEIRDAYARLGKLVEVAAQQFEVKNAADATSITFRPLPGSGYDRGGSAWRDGSRQG